MKIIGRSINDLNKLIYLLRFKKNALEFFFMRIIIIISTYTLQRIITWVYTRVYMYI